MLKNLKEKIFLAAMYNGMEVLDGWAIPADNKVSIGKYRDSKGNPLNGVFKRNTQEDTTEIFFINKGNIVYNYKMPYIISEGSVKSQMVNWKNLCYHHVGQIFLDQDANPLGNNLTVLLPIIKGRKPCSMFLVSSDEQLAKAIQIMKKNDIVYTIHNVSKSNSQYFINAAHKGYIQEYIDINKYISLLYDHAKLSHFKFFNKVDINLIYTMLNREIIDVMKDFDFGNELYPELIVVTGLCLGFPPEAVIGYLLKDDVRERINKK